MSFDLVCYLNFGYPTIEKGIEDVRRYYECGCRTIQLDIPSRDPYLEQPRIKERMAYCLATNPDYQSYLDGISQVCKLFPDMTIHFMLYGNTVEELGIDRIISECKKNGITHASFVGADTSMRDRLSAEGFATAAYVQSHLPEAEVAAAISADFVAYQVRPLEGQEQNPNIHSYADGIKYLRDRGVKADIYATVGIKTPEDITMVKAAGANGAFIGGVLMKVIDDAEKLREVLSSYVAAANE